MSRFLFKSFNENGLRLNPWTAVGVWEIYFLFLQFIVKVVILM